MTTNYIVLETFGGLIDSVDLVEYPTYKAATAYIASRPAPRSDKYEYLLIERMTDNNGEVGFSVDSYTENHCDHDTTLWPDDCR